MNGWFALAGLAPERAREMASLMSPYFHWLSAPATEYYTSGDVLLGRVSPASDPITCDAEARLAIVGTVRLVSRAELRAELDFRAAPVRSDEELTLAAYRKWGADLVDHIAGDFSFAIWDGSKRTLIVARDHFGIMPLYFAESGSGMVASNSLGAIAAIPGIADQLNERWVGDFLLFEQALDEDATVYQGVRRLSRAQTLAWTRHGHAVKKYWTLPVYLPEPQLPQREWPAAFREVLQLAVEDRTGKGPVAVSLSGGLDSSSIAALAVSSAGAPKVKGFSQRWRLPDPEQPHVEVIAHSLGIRVEFIESHAVAPFSGDIISRLPEPMADPVRDAASQFMSRVAAHSPRLLSGEGGDEVLMPATLGEGIGWKEVVSGALPYLLRRRRLPPVGLRTWLSGKSEQEPELPLWLNEHFVDRADLRERLRLWQQRLAMPEGRRRKAWRALMQVAWLPQLESLTPEYTGHPVTVAYPFLDLRVVHFALALPPIPWCLNKELLRQAMAGMLPGTILLRPKTPFGADTVQAALKQWQPTGRIYLRGKLAQYVETARLPHEITKVPPQILMLAFWLNSKGILT